MPRLGYYRSLRLPGSGFQAAIAFAEQGFPVYEGMHEIWAAPNIVRGLEGKSARVFLPGGKPPETGQLFRNPDMAHALRLDAEQGPDPFYKGQIATAIQHLGGTMTAEDLAGFSPEWVQPIFHQLPRLACYELPPNGQGVAQSRC